ncbi:IS6 family transposase [Antarcticimicrobium luteum]|uniref:IS6 family transposase n=1 Tax=Antarcticimicrobium luteum TaxID=2547397 RepID=UPI0024785251|nr:IS6 family transposase [Antarcticimicrobium luteum]
MQTPSISYKRHRFPPSIIAHAVWLYVRFNLSLCEVEEMLLERGIDVSYKAVRRWTAKFGPQIARNLRRRQRRPGDIWHLDEVVVKISGKTFWFWRAVDQHGAVLDEILQSRRDKRAAKRLLRKLMKRAGSVPKRIITDKLRSCRANAPDDLDHEGCERGYIHFFRLNPVAEFGTDEEKERMIRPMAEGQATRPASP